MLFIVGVWCGSLSIFCLLDFLGSYCFGRFCVHDRVMDILLSREKFKALVLSRHGGVCCFPGCGREAVDAHHILNRNLWSDGGYYLRNGAALCSVHHLDAEYTLISCEDLWGFSGSEPLLADSLAFGVYDTWGNFIFSDGSRSRGPLFHDEGCRRALRAGGVLHLFTAPSKFPRILHLPTSPGISNDDKVLKDTTFLFDGEVLVTEKKDGQNFTLTAQSCYARSVDSSSHSSQAWVRSLHGRVAHELPAGWRFVGENMFARHSIAYDSLESFFLLFAVFDEFDELLSWEDTLVWASLLGFSTVPVIYCGSSKSNALAAWGAHLGDVGSSEGFVVRRSGSVPPEFFSRSVAKWVRADHVQTDDRWSHGVVVANKLRKEGTS